MIAVARASLYFVVFSIRRQLRSRKLWVAGGILGVILLAVGLIGINHTWSAREFGAHVVLGFLSLFYLPTIGLLFGTAPLSELREERTLGWLLVRPLPRPLLYLGQLLASVPLALAFAVGGFALVCALAAHFGRPEVEQAFAAYAPAIVCGVLAYLALFHLLSALWRHSLLIAFAYVFFVEVFVGNIPGFLKQFSVSFYVRSLAFAGGAEWIPERRAAFFGFLPGDEAMQWLLALTFGLTVAGMVVFSRREYPGAI